MKAKWSLSTAVFVLAAMGAGGAPAYAQTAPVTAAPAEDDVRTADIVVTANRRNQALQDVPMTLQAFSTETLSKLNITTFNATSLTNTTYTVLEYQSQAISMPSAFSDFYDLQSIPAVKSSFGTIFPIMFFILLPLFVANFFNRFLILLKMDRFQFGAGS